MKRDYDTALEACAAAAESSGISALIAESDSVIVGYSGGADSSLLLRLMKDMLSGTGKALYAAHLNHGIRGKEADDDEDFCRTECDKLGIPFISEKADVPLLSRETGCGIEETARKARYDFFERCSRKLGGKTVVATAHNADDNLETVLFNLLRGCGANGISGIPPVRDGKYIRPMLTLTSETVRKLCADEGISFRIDSTNVDTDYTRNYMRAEIIPRLRKITPHPEVQATKMSSLLRSDCEYIDSEVQKLISEENDRGIPLKLLREAPRAIGSRLMIAEYDRKKASHTASALSARNIEDLERLARLGRDGDKISLPGGLTAVIDKDVLAVEQDSGPAEPFYGIAEFGMNDFGEYGFSILIEKGDKTIVPEIKDQENIYKLSIHKTVRFDTIKGRIVIRSRKPGDTYRYGGVNRKVKKLLCDKKISRRERERLPLVCDDDGVIWIPGFPLRDGCEAKEGTENTVTIGYIKNC